MQRWRACCSTVASFFVLLPREHFYRSLRTASAAELYIYPLVEPVDIGEAV